MKLTTYQLELLNHIDNGELCKYCVNIVSYPQKRKRFSIDMATLLKIGICQRLSDEVIIITDNKYYRQYLDYKSGIKISPLKNYNYEDML